MTSQEAAVKAQEQLGLVYASGGAPFKTIAGAKRGIDLQGLNSSNYEIIPVLDEEEEVVGYAGKPIKSEEEYWWVKFQSKGHPNDEDQVMLSVEGEALKMQRDKEVCIPQRFLECADHATYEDWRMEPNKPRKSRGKVTKFPYHKIRLGTREEFETQLATGTAKTKAHLERYGWDADVE